jgi:hypothetical protein
MTYTGPFAATEDGAQEEQGLQRLTDAEASVDRQERPSGWDGGKRGDESVEGQHEIPALRTGGKVSSSLSAITQKPAYETAMPLAVIARGVRQRRRNPRALSTVDTETRCVSNARVELNGSEQAGH